MKERNFTPKIRKSDKYKKNITMSFEDRRLKSIELKNKYKKAKKIFIVELNLELNLLQKKTKKKLKKSQKKNRLRLKTI